MKKLLFTTLFLTLVGSIVLYAQPIIRIEGGNSYDWGKVKASDTQLKASVKIFNDSKMDSLRIYKVKPGCGCTTAPLDKELIEPGGFATLDITLNIGNYTGAVNKSINIRTNDPDNRTVIYKIKCNVERPITVIPKFLHFNKIFIGEESKAKVTLHNTTDRDITLKDFKVEPKELKLNLNNDTVIPAHSKVTLEGTLVNNSKGRFSGQITIKTDHPDVVHLKIKVHGVTREKTSAPNDPTSNRR